MLEKKEDSHLTFRSIVNVFFLQRHQSNIVSWLDKYKSEGVNIANFRGDVLMIRRGELGGVRIERQQYRRWGANWKQIKTNGGSLIYYQGRRGQRDMEVCGRGQGAAISGARWVAHPSNNMEGGAIISIFLITRWVTHPSNNMEGGAIISIFLITRTSGVS